MAKVRSSRVGETLAGKYRLDALLGAGGMGEVYRAENLGLGRAVAIKVLREEHAENAEVVARFLREARAANIVRHPNVVDVVDIGQAEDGTPFIVQELLDGEDLAAYAHGRGGALAVNDALAILIPAIDAVAFAHARGVIHRDLKPENLFLARDPTGAIIPKLLDFGISRIVTGDEQRMTATGMSVGTPAYMSPEQIRADKIVDARTDVWSIGVMLFELLAGALPFQSSSHTGLFVKIVTELPMPLGEAVPGVPPELAAIVEKCLRARSDERYSSAAEVARDLRAVLGGGSAPELPRIELAAPRVVSSPRISDPTMDAPVDPILVVPDLALPAPKPKPAANPRPPPSARAAQPPPSSKARARVVEGADMAGEIIPLADLRLDLAADPSVRPMVSARVARATHGNRTDVQEDPQRPVRSLFGMGIMWALVLVLTGTLTTVAPSGWPVVIWATALDGAPPWAGYGAAGLALLLGIMAFVAGARADPISWGLLVAAPGLVVDGLLLAGFVVHGLPSLTGSGGLDALARLVFPWPTMLILLGLCVVALRHGWGAWSSQHSGRTTAAAVGVVLAALALFGAVEIFRGAETAPQSTNIAS